jgi:hypothetical protein
MPEKDVAYIDLMREELRHRREHIAALELALSTVARTEKQKELVLMLIYVDQTAIRSVQGEFGFLVQSH